jgi:ferredoxin
MAFVVCEPCRNCKYTDCVVVCPCECFYEDELMLYIDADHCIDCEACESECPVAAIFADQSVPDPWKNYIALNAERTRELRSAGVGHITEKQSSKVGNK